MATTTTVEIQVKDEALAREAQTALSLKTAGEEAFADGRVLSSTTYS